jgi:hypothetical protein
MEDKGDNGGADLIKRLLVAIVGKLGQREKRWVSVPNADYDKPWGFWYARDEQGQWQRWRCLAWRVEKEVKGGFSNDAVPAIASWITSCARIRLLHAIRLAGKENVFYIDTDALIVSDCGLRRLRSAGIVKNGELGYLSEKGSGNDCAIFGIKSYRLGGKSVHAGVPQDGKITASGDVFYSRFAKATEQIREGNAPRARRIDWRSDRSETYRHGTLQESGEVRPIELKEW